MIINSCSNKMDTLVQKNREISLICIMHAPLFLNAQGGKVKRKTISFVHLHMVLESANNIGS